MAIYWRCSSLYLTMLFILKSFFLYYSDSYSPSRFISETSSFNASTLFVNSTLFLVNSAILSSFTASKCLNSFRIFSNLSASISF